MSARYQMSILKYAHELVWRKHVFAISKHIKHVSKVPCILCGHFGNRKYRLFLKIQSLHGSEV